MTSDKIQLGAWGENVAATHLQAKGYEIIAKNWRSALGEIDIIARWRDCYSFIEVKTRRGSGMGSPEEALTQAKSQKLLALAQQYLADHELDVDWQIDLVAVELDSTGKLIRCEHLPNVILGW